MLDEALPETVQILSTWADGPRIQWESRLSQGSDAPRLVICRVPHLNVSFPHGFPVRPIRPGFARRAAAQGRASGRRGRGRRRGDALGVAVGRRARRRGRGIAARRGQRRRPARHGRQEAGGGFDQRPERRRRQGAGRARGGDGQGRAGGPLRGPGRRRAAGEELSRSRPGGPRPAGHRRAGKDRAPRRGGRPHGQGRQQVGRRVGFGGDRRHGAADEPRLLRRLSRLAPQRVDAGHRRRRHRHGDRLRFLLGAARFGLGRP